MMGVNELTGKGFAITASIGEDLEIHLNTGKSKEMTKNNSVDAPPIPSATILMLRDRNEAMEVFMVVRHHQIDFASGALVFPGGKADPNDFDPALRQHIDGADPNENRCAIQVAAIREAFEECGILLARDESGSELIAKERLQQLDHYRTRLHGGELSVLDFLREENLRLAADRLVHFAHWITPENLPKRFDTHFFLAKAPEDHLATHDGYESVDSVWIQPSEAFEDAEAGRRSIIFPTLRNVAKLAQSKTTEEAIKRAGNDKIITVLPKMETRPDGVYLSIPPEAGYDISEELLPPEK